MDYTIDDLELVVAEYIRWAELNKVPKRNPIITPEQDAEQLEMCRKCSESEKPAKCDICPGVTGFVHGREPKGYKKRN